MPQPKWVKVQRAGKILILGVSVRVLLNSLTKKISVPIVYSCCLCQRKFIALFRCFRVTCWMVLFKVCFFFIVFQESGVQKSLVIIVLIQLFPSVLLTSVFPLCTHILMFCVRYIHIYHCYILLMKQLFVIK